MSAVLRPALALLVLLPGLLAGSRRSQPAPEAAPEPPPVPASPTMPTSTDSPYDDQSPAPPLAGTTTPLDLEALAHSTIVYTFTADVSEVGRVDGASKGLLLRQLATDPRWRVCELDDTLVALDRVPDGSAEWAVPRTGHHDSRRLTSRTLLRFGAWPATNPWASSKLVVRATPDAPKMRITAYTMTEPPWKDQIATALVVQGPAVALEVLDIGDEDQRQPTIDALGSVPVYLYAVNSRMSTVATKGWVNLPPSDPGAGHPYVEVSSSRKGHLDVRGRANPGAPGWVWVRVLDGDLVPWEEEAVAIGTRERMGWSDNPKQLFWFQGEFPVPRGRGFTATMELWFQPDGSRGEPERLLALPVKMPRR